MKLHAFLKLFFPMIPVSYQRNMLLNSHEPAITQLSRMCLSATVSQYVRHNRITALILNYRDEGAADYIWSHYAYAMAHFLEHKVNYPPPKGGELLVFASTELLVHRSNKLLAE